LTADLDVRIADWKWGTFGFRFLTRLIKD